MDNEKITLDEDVLHLTPEHINSRIINEQYHVFPETTLTICALHLKNGFTVIGESACATPEIFNQEIGEKIAYQKAKEKIWQLEGYLLRERLHRKKEDHK